MAIIVDDKPTPANAGTSQNLCASNFTLNANNPYIGTGLWTVIVGGSSVTTPTLNTSTVTGLITGTNTLIWTTSNGVCASSSSTIDLYVNPFPTPANAGPDQNICTNTATLAGNTPAVGFGIWTVITGSGSVLTNTVSNSPVTGLSNGINTFVWTTAFGTCPNSPDTVIILVDSLPTISLAGSSQTLCSTTATLNANNPLVGIGTWSVLAGGSSVTTSTLNSSGITGLATGNNIFEWTIANGACPSSTSTVSIFVDTYPDISNAGADFTICASTATLSSNTPTIGTGVWSVIAGGSSVTNPTLTSSPVTGLSTGTNSLVWTISNGTCPSSTSTVNIFVDAFPSAVSAGPDQTFCLTTTTANLNASIPAIGVTSWSVISGGGVITTPTLNVSDVSGLTTGTNTIVWTNSNGVCPATSDTMNIVLLMFPTPANAGPDQTLCPNSTVLAGNLPAIGMGTWSVIVGSGAVATSTLNNSGITALSTGTNSLVWTTANGNCPTSSDTVQLIVLPPVQQAYAGNDTTIYTTSLTVNGNIPVSGTGQWQFVGGSYNIINPNQNSTQLTNLVPGVNTIKWTITETCGTTEDELNITLAVLQIPNAFSPNGDGINDYFEIPIADYYSHIEIKVVNRWGNLVFEDNDYKNKWNGVNQDGQPLAEDNYFYVAKLDNETKTGYVLIKR
jgi:gliding motility-associated-like protein